MSGWLQYPHANESNTVTAKEDVKQNFPCCNVIWTLISWFLSGSYFWESLTPHIHSKNKWWPAQVVIILYKKEKETGYFGTWIFFNIYLCIAYFIRFMTSYTMRRTCVYLVKSGGARIYVVCDVLLNILQGPRTFVYQKPKSLQPRVLVAKGN